jgi:sterol desaturase/sphingolipid hydroxylase (fatty acid hydroxylase superfamily)
MITAEHAIALSVPLTYAVLVAYERLRPGWQWPAQRGWELMGVGCFMALMVVNAFVSSALGVLLPGAHVLDLSQLHFAAATAIGFLVQTLGNALLHRAYHRSDFLWRHAHQLHHAPARMGVAGVMLQAPLEMLLSATLFVAVTRLLLGLDPVATMAVAWLASFYGMFQHCNMRTPRWLGWIIQRPEAHCAHHRRGVHAGNYSDFPPWDLLWGALDNPRGFTGEIGFEPEAARGIGRMLAGRDVQRELDATRTGTAPRPGHSG